MNTITLIIVAAIAFGGYHYVQEQKKQAATAAPAGGNAAGSKSASSGPFIDVPAITGDDGAVLVVAQENCPAEEAQRADRLATDLGKNGVRVRRAHGIEFANFDPQQFPVEQLQGLMNGPLPVVFVSGRGKNNPSLGEVLAEYGRK